MIPGSVREIGVDVGATLSKLAIREDGDLRFRLVASDAIERAAAEVESLAPESVGLTGAGAPELAVLLASGGLKPSRVVEFDAWRAGASALLARQAAGAPERDLLISVGTGTSMLRVRREEAERVGGTALGGGTLMGLGAALLGVSDFDALVALAARGDRRKVDLLVSDIDRSGELPLAGAMTAAALAKLARPGAHAAEPADVAHALIGLVGENVGLLAGAIAHRIDAKRIVYGGATLRGNEALRSILAVLAQVHGREVVFLDYGEFAGALGALELTRAGGRSGASR